MAVTMQEIIDALRDDGDTITIDDNVKLRLRVQPDDYSIMHEQGEGVWCGKLEWGTQDPYNWGWHRRPDGFTGRSEVILTDRNDRLWWEIPADVEIGSEVYRNLRNEISDCLNYGYNTVGVEVLSGIDHYGRAIVVDASWIGGVSINVDASDCIDDLVHELNMAEQLLENA